MSGSAGHISITCTRGERQRWHDIAASYNMPTSVFVRAIIDGAIQRRMVSQLIDAAPTVQTERSHRRAAAVAPARLWRRLTDQAFGRAAEFMAYEHVGGRYRLERRAPAGRTHTSHGAWAEDPANWWQLVDAAGVMPPRPMALARGNAQRLALDVIAADEAGR